MSGPRRVGRIQYAMLVRLADAYPGTATVAEVVSAMGDDVKPLQAVRSLSSLVRDGYVEHACVGLPARGIAPDELTGPCPLKITEQGMDARKGRDRKPYNRRPAREYVSKA